jgi:hypothetical protein
MRYWMLALLVCAAPLWCQEAPEPEVEDTITREPSRVSPFRWRVGASLAVSHGALLSDPQFNDTMPDEGIVGEFAFSARVSAPAAKVSANMRVCWGCHQLELEEASFQWQPLSFVTLKAGRMAVNAGSYNTRHDFSVRRTVSKPITRIMGNMPRQTEFNHGVLPAPYVDNGASITAGHRIGRFGLEGEGFVLTGLKGQGAADINFITSRQFRDNNGEPSVGGRLTFDAPHVSTTFAYLWGNYDPNARRSYQIFSADTRIRAGPLTVEAEFALRETEYNDPESSGGENDWLKYGWWVSAAWNFTDALYVVGAVDALYVKDIYLSNFGPTPNEALAVTDDNNRIVRLTGGVGYTAPGGVMLRASAEFWDFSDFNDAWVIHVGIGWAF